MPDSPENHGAAAQETAAPQVSLTLLIAVLGLASFVSTFSMRLVDPVVPLIANEFAIGLVQAAMLAPVFTFSYAFGQPLIGPVADSLGKVRIIGFSLAALGLITALAAFATNFQMLVLLRGIAGVAGGGIIPVAMAAVADRVPMQNRQLMLSRLLTLMVLGQVGGSFCSGAVGDWLGWRSSFLVSAVCSLLAAGLVFWQLKPRKHVVRARLSLSNVLASYGNILHNPQTLRVCGLVMLESCGVFACFPFVAELLQSRGAKGAAEAGFALAIFGLGGLAYTLVAGPLISRLGQSRMAAIGGIMLAAVLIGLSLPLPRYTAPVLFGFYGLGFYLIHSTLQAQATELSADHRSSAMAIFACCLFFGTAMGPISLAILRQIMPLETTLLVYAALLLSLGLSAGRILGFSAQRPR
jgi:MFS transporter, YNFM family, putative membrane transport protein